MHRLAGLLRSNGGRITVAASVAAALIAATVLVTVAVLPAGAGPGAASVEGVQPTEVNLGGQPNDCPAVSTAATYELRIQNPQDDQTYPGPGGVSFTLDVDADDLNFDYVLNGEAVVFDVVVKGGQKSTHFDYDATSDPGPVTADQRLHAPSKGNSITNLFNISHVSFCYEDAVALTGNVQVDGNADSELETDGPEAGRVVRAYSSTGEVASATTNGYGDYTMFVARDAGSLLVCEDVRSGYVQITDSSSNYSPGKVCSGVSDAEEEGHSVADPATHSGSLDFDNALEVCGQTLSATGGAFLGYFELFGDNETGCEGKAGDLSIDGSVVALPIVGTGTVAGFGRITKTFPTEPLVFEPLEFSTTLGGPYVDLDWCGMRDKVTEPPEGELADPDQFDPYVPAGKYPTTAEGVVSCKVFEGESLDGSQVTIVYFDEDPYWR